MKPILTAAVLALVAAPAFAFHCPADMAKIDEALKTASLSAEDMEKVKALRATGEEQHKAGEHQASVDSLAEAMKLLGM